MASQSFFDFGRLPHSSNRFMQRPMPAASYDTSLSGDDFRLPVFAHVGCGSAHFQPPLLGLSVMRAAFKLEAANERRGRGVRG